MHSTNVLVNINGIFSGHYLVDGRKTLLATFFARAILPGPGWKKLSAVLKRFIKTYLHPLNLIETCHFLWNLSFLHQLIIIMCEVLTLGLFDTKITTTYVYKNTYKKHTSAFYPTLQDPAPIFGSFC